jgi:hypothetical protein
MLEWAMTDRSPEKCFAGKVVDKRIWFAHTRFQSRLSYSAPPNGALAFPIAKLLLFLFLGFIFSVPAGLSKQS